MREKQGRTNSVPAGAARPAAPVLDRRGGLSRRGRLRRLQARPALSGFARPVSMGEKRRRQAERHPDHPRHDPGRPSGLLRVRRRLDAEPGRHRRPGRSLRAGGHGDAADAPGPLHDHDRHVPDLPRRPGQRQHGPRRRPDDARRGASPPGATRPAPSSPPSSSTAAGASSRASTHYDDQFDLKKYKHLDLGEVQRPGNEVVDAALAWLDGAKAKPFFAWVHLYDPHMPYAPPEPYASAYARRGPYGLYDGEIAFMDEQIGRLTDWLARNGLDKSTVDRSRRRPRRGAGEPRRRHARLLRLRLCHARPSPGCRCRSPPCRESGWPPRSARPTSSRPYSISSARPGPPPSRADRSWG